MKKAKVIFVKERSDPEELGKVKRFSPILEYFAQTRQTTIYVDAPHGQPVEPEGQDAVYIHFFSFPGSGSSTRPLGFANRLYDFPVPIDELEIIGGPEAYFSRGNDVGSRFFRNPNQWSPWRKQRFTALISTAPVESSMPSSYIIESPEGRGIIEIVPPCHVYILFDIAHRPWEGEEVVLWQMLFNAFSYLYSKSYSKTLAQELILRDDFHSQVAEASEQLENDFRTLCLLNLKWRLEGVVQKQAEDEREYELKSQDYVNTAFEIDELQARLENPAHSLSDEELTKEFKKILAMKAVRGIEIRQIDNQIQLLSVYTNFLTMENEFGSFPIGEYVILITSGVTYGPEMLIRAYEVVEIAEGKQKGPYRHPGIATENPQRPCLGIAISPALNKALADYDFPAVVHLLLVYLTLDNRKVPVRAGEHRVPATPSQPKPFYADSAELDKACKSYIALARRFKEFNISEVLSRRRDHADARQSTLTRGLIILRDALSELQEKKAWLQNLIRYHSSEEELQKLLNDPSLIYLKAVTNPVKESHWLWAVFSPQEGYGEFESTIVPSMAFLFKISLPFKVFVFFSEEGKSTPFKRQKINLHDGTLRLTKEEFEIFTKLVINGKLGTAILAVHELLCGRTRALLANSQ